MSTRTDAQDGSEDVNDFLARIKELGEKRDQEDELRNKKLEEEILQGRKERQARRERARSISPTKSSPSHTFTDAQYSASPESRLASMEPEKAVESPRDAAPATRFASPHGSEHDEREPTQRDSSIRSSPSNAMPSRSSTLSWQRRPNSQTSDKARSRPLSMVATHNAARSPRATPEPSSAPAEPALSRDEIAKSLASKDPAWFRQTADRGAGSPAYRKNQVEDGDRADHNISSRVHMPGMSREGSEVGEKMNDPEDRASSPARSVISSKASGYSSPMPMTSAQRLDPPGAEFSSEARRLAMSPSQGRISPDRIDRSPSPTKGLGGFVQSAMMKRSDSVNKRWSVTSPSGLTRGNSIASNRSSHDPTTTSALGSIVNASIARPISSSRENSPMASSRPTSSHSNATTTADAGPGTSNSARSTPTASADNEGFVKPSIPASRSQAPMDIKNQENSSETSRKETTPPVSPSKTMDPRRWSPTKSSWLESALNKPESPKPKPAAVPQQPAWMAEIAKAKQKSVDLGRKPSETPKHEVNIGGLMRSPPMGGFSRPMSIGGLPEGFAAGVSSKRRQDSISSQSSKISPSREEPDKLQSPSPVVSKHTSLDIKSKPITPPKKDFRNSLKPRQAPPDREEKEDPEFKNVFGQLRRTKTQNYVPPDELKDNITRGKAALNLTGGPKKTEIKDEFKDAILQKKDDFKKAQLDGKGVVRSPSSANQDVLPEALAKRNTLNASDFLKQTTSVSPTTTKSGTPSTTSASDPDKSKAASGGKLAGRLNPALAGLISRGPPSAASNTSRSSSTALSQRTVSMSTSTTNGDESGPQLTHMTKSRARGPKRKAPSTAPSVASSTQDSRQAEPVVAERVHEIASSPAQPIPELASSPAKETIVDIENAASQPPSPRKLDLKRRSQFLQEAPNKSNKGEPILESQKPLSPPTKKISTFESLVKEEPKAEIKNSPKLKPAAPAKSATLSSKSSEASLLAERLSARNVTEPDSPLPLKRTITASSIGSSDTGAKAQPPIHELKKPAVTKIEDKVQPQGTIKEAASRWGRPSPAESLSDSPRVRSPIKLPTHADEKIALVRAGLRPASPVKDDVSPKTSARPLPETPVKKSATTPITPIKSSTLNAPQGSDASRGLTAFFEQQGAPPAFTADTTAILSAHPYQSISSIKTLRSSLYQFSADGKKQQVPNHQERLLFEGNMYICVHAFGNASGKKITEVYFWTGDEVPASEIEGAEMFAQREAKAAGGTLVKIRQGKETPEFFTALGGIIIVRRGTSNKFDSLAPHILCGRKCFGQIAFDEVDYSASSLCSGFPYLISTPGQSYLWKGKGSGIDELSCARLIGMDFGLTGEIEEVDDGHEPESFTQIFGKDTKIPRSADHWQKKSNYEKYCGRLFRADAASSDSQLSPMSLKRRWLGTPEPQITEIAPFSQNDLSPSHIYILDAFFEIYIIVGSSAQSQYAAFHNALTFVQEYGILASGTEDRPYVPVTTVVLEGAPRDMKSVFRKWKDAPRPVQVEGLKRGKSLKVVPLSAALDATKRR